MKNIKLTNEEKKKHTPIEKAIKDTVKEKKTAKVELVSYSITSVISTGDYSNIQPTIVVKAQTLEDAEAYTMPHLNKLRNDYYLISLRRVPAPVVAVKEVPAPVANPTVNPVMPVEPIKITVNGNATGMTAMPRVEPVKEMLDPNKTNQDIARLTPQKDPLHSEAYNKAKSAAESCVSKEALNLIKEKIATSPRLTDTEKYSLLNVTIVAKEKTL